MNKIVPAAALALALAACGEKPAPVEETAASLAAGLYELNGEVSELTQLDKRTSATKLKLGDKLSIKGCVAGDGTPAVELLAEDGDKCEFRDKYVRNGRISAQLACTREGVAGQISPMLSGKFKADSFEGEITTGTYLYDHANYRLVRKVTAKRIGDCPPEAAKTA